MKLYLASGNAHKAAELQAMADASGLTLEIRTARELGGMPPVAEDTGTFVGNARKKAEALRAKLPAGTAAWVMADDSGLCVDALHGAPGVESAYYAGPEGDGAANLRKLIHAMRDVQDESRGAHFVCVLLCIAPDGREHIFTGRAPGRLRREPRGGEGFGYDPLFVPTGHDQTFAEMPAAQKNALSHRAQAWAEFAGWFPTASR